MPDENEKKSKRKGKAKKLKSVETPEESAAQHAQLDASLTRLERKAGIPTPFTRAELESYAKEKHISIASAAERLGMAAMYPDRAADWVVKLP